MGLKDRFDDFRELRALRSRGVNVPLGAGVRINFSELGPNTRVARDAPCLGRRLAAARTSVGRRSCRLPMSAHFAPLPGMSALGPQTTTWTERRVTGSPTSRQTGDSSRSRLRPRRAAQARERCLDRRQCRCASGCAGRRWSRHRRWGRGEQGRRPVRNRRRGSCPPNSPPNCARTRFSTSGAGVVGVVRRPPTPAHRPIPATRER